ncbi:TonB-dependent receptor [Marinirhabdus gelatinilytica]|uniref:TonB-dependent receptor-like protein n=1 Tax=Marinirhabdus gelatinilytica TaxID=1703343 RepID=A0A370QK33_9FLAO|nr:carboxypeptidase regulatory-like domain-containing protein [Marinirhabdus gelatinilytica]RDK88712.1 TonB-dependent receptor-like protein [Marinirhabdus gelatinilytica]
MRKLLLITLFFAGLFSGFSQGLTTSAINGQVTDTNGEPLVGANIVALHVPSGTKYGAITDFDGYYRVPNMRPGGPYTVTITYVGFAEYIKNEVYLQLGDSQRISPQMSEEANALEEVLITAQRDNVFDSNRTGTETTVTERDILTLPAASRSIADFVRVTPQAQLTEGDDGFSISLAGQNNRYNAIYIDGAVNNDVFGLAGSGTNGGQTGVNPFSVDAIESFQVNIAPFDVRQSGFSGGSISAITRSGTNTFKGSVYGFLRNESLAGKTPVDLVEEDGEREKLDEFSAKTYGMRLGGPIIKDKLFFFVNYERQDDETPQPFNFGNYEGRSSAADIDNLRNFLINTYGYDPGGFNANTRTLTSNKFTAKIDWNVNDNNKISFRHGLVTAENLEARSSNNRNIGFINGSEQFESTTNSSALEWNSNISDKVSNKLVLGYTAVRDDRDPSGSPFPSVDIQDGIGTITFGAEPFSTANLLDQDIFTVNNNLEIYSGAHTITLGANLEHSKSKNLFFAFNYGDYTFEDQFDDDNNLISSGLNQFLTGQDADVYQHGYSLVGDGTVGDESAGASEFSLTQVAFYAQDEIQFGNNFKFTYGIRADIPYWEDGRVNNDFNERTIPILESFGKDLQDAKVGQAIDPKLHLSPRLGFNWDVKDNNKTQVRGGLGVFTSRVPLVWPGGTYNNNGVTGGFNFEIGQPFEPNINNQFEDPAPTPNPDNSVGSETVGGNVDLFAKGFKLPQVMKYNIGVDQKLPFWNLIVSGDFLYTDVITDIYYENLNIKGPVGTLNGSGDNRPFYDRGDAIDDTYGSIILASNTGEGHAYNATVSLRKPFQNGFQGQVSYSYGESFKIFEGTSSQNTSQWRNQITVNGKNSRLEATESSFSLGHRISANASYELKWSENVKTTIGLFYEGLDGQPFSFIYNEGRDLLNDDSRDNALIYVPENSSEITFANLTDSEGNVIATPEQQWEQFNAFIENDEYLRTRRGGYAERNGSRLNWSHILDLKFLQDFSITTGNTKHTLQASLDIFNFTNLLNKEWGVREFAPNFGEIAPLTTVSGGPDPVFTFDARNFEDDRLGDIDDSGIASSRWQMQIGLRYLFN